jgi:hypothetical protein
MPRQEVREASIDKLVESYLFGNVSLEDAIARLHEPHDSWSEIVLRVILPGDTFRRRLERMAWRQSRTLISGSAKQPAAS